MFEIEGALQLLFYKVILKIRFTMAPEVHGAEVLPDPDYRSKNVIPPPTSIGVPYNFCFIKFSPNQTVEAAEAHLTLFRAPLTPGVGVWG